MSLVSAQVRFGCSDFVEFVFLDQPVGRSVLTLCHFDRHGLTLWCHCDLVRLTRFNVLELK